MLSSKAPQLSLRRAREHKSLRGLDLNRNRSFTFASHRNYASTTSVASTGLMTGLIGMQLLLSSIAFADEASIEAAASPVSSDISPVEILLLVCPLLAYAFFNKIRETNPQAGFGEYALALAFTVIISNLVSIVAFQTRIY